MRQTIRAKFLWKRSENRFPEGWQMEGQSDFRPNKGGIIPHDMMEHFPGDHRMDSPQELLALGAMVYLRFEESRVARAKGDKKPMDVPYHIATVVEAFSEERKFDFPDNFPLPKRRNILPLIAKAEEYFHESCSLMRSEQKMLYKRDIKLIDWKTYALWLTEGYYRAKRRYKGIDPFELAKLMVELSKKIKDISTDYLGHLSILSVTFSTAMVISIDLAKLDFSISVYPTGFDKHEDRMKFSRRQGFVGYGRYSPKRYNSNLW
jgi:hypothetical protein